MILPVFKLGTLALKSFCKPIGNRIKKEAGYHPRFRNFIINIAQANHRLSTKLQRRIYGHATDVAIRPLNEDKAVQAAADLLGELFVFSVEYIDSLKLPQKIEIPLRRVQPFEHLISVQNVLIVTSATKVAGVAVIFEVQRSSRSEARKEEVRRKELEALKQRDDDLSRELEFLKNRIDELERHSKTRGLSSIFSISHAESTKGKVKAG